MALLVGIVIFPPASGGVCDAEPNAKCLREWIQAAGSILALVGAAFGAYYLNKQIVQSERQHVSDRQRRHASIRSAMPLTLATVSVYAENTFDYLKNIRSKMSSHNTVNDVKINAPPPIPEDIISIFREFIETSDDDKSKLIQKLISEIQIQNSRVQSLYVEKKSHISISIDAFLLKSAIICVTNNSFYEYARFESDFAPSNIKWSEVKKFIGARLHGSSFDDVLARAGRYADNEDVHRWPMPNDDKNYSGTARDSD